MECKIELTWSKIIALLVLVYAFVEDVGAEGHAALTYALPFIVILIGGKQALDARTKIKNGHS